MSDAAVAFPFSIAAPSPLTPPAPLSPRERGEKDQRELLLYPLLSPGERRGRGGEGRRRDDAETEGNGGIGHFFPGDFHGYPDDRPLIRILASPPKPCYAVRPSIISVWGYHLEDPRTI